MPSLIHRKQERRQRCNPHGSQATVAKTKDVFDRELQNERCGEGVHGFGEHSLLCLYTHFGAWNFVACLLEALVFRISRRTNASKKGRTQGTKERSKVGNIEENWRGKD